MADRFADMPATVAPTLPLTVVSPAISDRSLPRTSSASGRSREDAPPCDALAAPTRRNNSELSECRMDAQQDGHGACRDDAPPGAHEGRGIAAASAGDAAPSPGSCNPRLLHGGALQNGQQDAMQNGQQEGGEGEQQHAAAQRDRFTQGTSRQCNHCSLTFESGNALHLHLPTCTARQGKRKAAPELEHPEGEPLTRPSKRPRFVHRGRGGNVDAIVDTDGTIYYDPAHARAAHIAVAASARASHTSPHRVWRRPGT